MSRYESCLCDSLALHDEVYVLEHDLFINLAPCLVLLACDDIMQGLERSVLLSHVLKFVCALEGILRPRESWSPKSPIHGCCLSIYWEWVFAARQ